MEAIINGIWSNCEESFWGIPLHMGKTVLLDVDPRVVELFSAATGAALVFADY
jgi:hypothetical protein